VAAKEGEERRAAGVINCAPGTLARAGRLFVVIFIMIASFITTRRSLRGEEGEREPA